MRSILKYIEILTVTLQAVILQDYIEAQVDLIEPPVEVAQISRVKR